VSLVGEAQRRVKAMEKKGCGLGRQHMRLVAVVLMILGSSAYSYGQDQSEQQKAPATKLEAFQARTGIVLIRGYTTVGTIRGLGGTVSVDAREFRDASNPNSPRATGISISVKETGRLERENTSYVDVEEVDSLVKGIEYIGKIGKDVTKQEMFEADYRTKGDLRIGVFNDSKGAISAVVSTGRIGRTTAYIKLQELDELRRLILLAKSKL
jgi:hypothetical protein